MPRAKPNFSADFARGKAALKEVYDSAAKKNMPLDGAGNNFPAFLSSVRADPLTSTFTENLGYYINELERGDTLNASAVGDAMQEAALEIKGQWHSRFSPQDIVNALIEETKSFRVKWALPWNWGDASDVPIYGSVYKALETAGEGAVSAIESTGTVMKVLPWGIGAVGLFAVYKWLVSPLMFAKAAAKRIEKTSGKGPSLAQKIKAKI